MTHISKFFIKASMLSILIGLVACGSDKKVPEFASNPPTKKKNSNAKPIGKKEIRKHAEENGAVWNLWTCKDLPPAPALDDQGRVQFQGVGPHNFPMTDSLKFDLEINGDFCAPKQMSRDIVFVIDVSESMRNQFNQGSDPVDSSPGGTCRRADAVSSVLDALSSETNDRFALVTFDSSVHQSSIEFYGASEFEQAFVDPSVLCTVGTDTNFKAALVEVEALFTKARSGTSKEVYFITDGIPDSPAHNGTDEALRIHQIGIIGTVVLGASDNLVKTTIATLTPSGEPLHVRVDQATEMPTMIRSLLGGDNLAGGSLIYQSLDNPANGVKIILDPVANSHFKVAEIAVSKADFPGGIKQVLSFWDDRGALFLRSGQIVWQ